MGYQSFMYLGVLLPLTLTAYAICPARRRKIVLLTASWAFFFLLSKWLLAVLIATTVGVYALGRAAESVKWRSLACSAGIAGLFAVLAITKYTNFGITIVGLAARQFGISLALSPMKLLAPIGISYYTLEAVGYLAEVKWGRIKPEHDFVRFALFLGFFPQIMEGPIVRYQDMADIGDWSRNLTAADLRNGSLRILWGLFKKMLIADRLNILVSQMYTHYTSYSGPVVAAAGIAYTVQLYMEFSGVMDICLGSARLFGIALPENFRQPFFSQNASEFWRRWHITLGVWLKTYVFYPITTGRLVMNWNRLARKKWKSRYLAKAGTSALALFPVWLFNGLWHGPHGNYLVYGMYYFVLLLLEVAMEPAVNALYRRTGIDRQEVPLRGLRMARTFFIVVLGEMYFRAASIRMGNAMLLRMFSGWRVQRQADGSLFSAGLDYADWGVILAGTAVVFIADFLREKGIRVPELVGRQQKAVRWAAYYALIFAVAIFGAYGTGYQQVDQIYAGF